MGSITSQYQRLIRLVRNINCELKQIQNSILWSMSPLANLFEHIEEKPETAKSLIGVSYEQFQDLVIQEEEYKKARRTRKKQEKN